VTLRYYLPDQGTGRTAGAPAPTVTTVAPTGQRIPTPTCKEGLGDPGYTLPGRQVPVARYYATMADFERLGCG
jgi:hypothetical protein